MNRRKFFFSSLSIALAGALPASLAAAAIAPCRGTTVSFHSWQHIDECRAHCGRRFLASGPIEAELRLSEVEAAGRHARNQFIATFEAPDAAPEGLYRLESGPDHLDLFLQPVHGNPGKLQAVFNLID